MSNNYKHKSVVTFEKPIQHLGLDDWHSRLNQLKNVADIRRNDAFALRHGARTLRNETDVQTDWDTYHNNAKLADRVAEINRWRITMETCLERIEKETNLLQEEKIATERELEALITPLTVVSECIAMRDNRLGSELTYDDGDTELKKELCIVETNQKLLREQCQSAWEKLNRLAEVKFKIDLEITNKAEAQDLDTQQYGLNKHCANITFKTDPTRAPKNSCTYQGWLEHNKLLKNLADKELEDTYAMRESLFLSREKSRNLLLSQQDRTEHTIRKRIFETQRARNELEWQVLKMKEEMEKCMKEIQDLEQAYRNKTDSLKLVETRLENRAQRSGMELCLDDVYTGLCNEVKQLRQTRKDLTDKINCAKTTYNALEKHTNRLILDLNNKQHSLMTDIRGLDLRVRLRAPGDSTDRNIEFTKMEDQIPKN